MARIGTARLSVRSQTVIPKRVRQRLGVGPGDTIAFEERDGDIVIRPVRRFPSEDPFVLFTEWASEADERAYAEF